MRCQASTVGAPQTWLRFSEEGIELVDSCRHCGLYCSEPVSDAKPLQRSQDSGGGLALVLNHGAHAASLRQRRSSGIARTRRSADARSDPHFVHRVRPRSHRVPAKSHTSRPGKPPDTHGVQGRCTSNHQSGTYAFGQVLENARVVRRPRWMIPSEVDLSRSGHAHESLRRIPMRGAKR